MVQYVEKLTMNDYSCVPLLHSRDIVNQSYHSKSSILELLTVITIGQWQPEHSWARFTIPNCCNHLMIDSLSLSLFSKWTSTMLWCEEKRLKRDCDSCIQAQNRPTHSTYILSSQEGLVLVALGRWCSAGGGCVCEGVSQSWKWSFSKRSTCIISVISYNN